MEVAEPARREIIDADDRMAGTEQTFTKMGSQKSCAAGNEYTTDCLIIRRADD
jgi:hypothetical protein